METDYPLLNLFFTMLIFFMFFIWIWLLIVIFGDIFRSDDMGGWSKALWTIFIIIVPFLGVLIYLIARGGSMQRRRMADIAQAQEQQRQYIQNVAGSGDDPANQLQKLADLHKAGVLTDEEFAAQKAKVLS
ncbi:MAG: SHOCT domain-containing protein [Actinomycetia bacterium]|nr:SHOCT domain-containing protein [Actinomycetes bacterium]